MGSEGFVQSSEPLDVIVAVNGDEVVVELDVRHNESVRIGDRYTAPWDDGTVTILRINSVKSADQYGNTIARRTDAMREGVVGVPISLTARKTYQTKLAIMCVEGE